MNTTQEWADASRDAAEHEARAAELAMPPRRFDEVLPCKLTDEELKQRAKDLVAVRRTIRAIEDEKKQINDQLKARLQLQEARERELEDSIESENEDRAVECIESFELRLGVARTTRTDTGEQIRERALRSSELQPSLPGTERPTVDALEDAEVDEPSDGDVTVIDDPESVLADVAEEPEARGSRRRKKGS